jgi:hypothetical protein
MIYLVSVLIIILINVVPLFMPPTWTFVSFVYVKYEVNLIVIALLGACSSTFGRFLLLLLSEKFSVIFRGRVKKNLLFIGERAKQSPGRIVLITTLWSIAPISSSYLFFSLGLAKVKVGWGLLGFFIGRSVSYAVLAFTTKIVYESLSEMFVEAVLDWRKLLTSLFGVVLVALYLLIDWKSLIMDKKLRIVINSN